MSAQPRAANWQLELVEGDPSGQLFVYVQPRTDDPTPLIDLYEELERWGTPPTQIVLSTDQELERRFSEVDGLFRRFAER